VQGVQCTRAQRCGGPKICPTLFFKFFGGGRGGPFGILVRGPTATLLRHWDTVTHSELNPVVDVQPVKFTLPELPQLLIVGLLVCGYWRQSRLQFVCCLLWRTNQETAAVVDTASDERVDESSGLDTRQMASLAFRYYKIQFRPGLRAGPRYCRAYDAPPEEGQSLLIPYAPLVRDWPADYSDASAANDCNKIAAHVGPTPLFIS